MSDSPTISEKCSFKNEFVAGTTTFFTMAYIIIVNPAILSTPGTGMTSSGVTTATVLLSFISTLLMGVVAKLPFAIAPGMGINAFVTFSLVLGNGIPWQTAMGMVFWSGVIFVLLSVTPVRVWIVEAIPENLRLGMAGGIGLFLVFIGLKNAHLVVANPVTISSHGPLGWTASLCMVGVIFGAILIQRGLSWAYLAIMTVLSVLGMLIGIVELPRAFLSMPDFSSMFLELDFVGALKPSLFAATISLLFTDLFDSISTFIGVSRSTNLCDSQGNPPQMKKALFVDALATLFSGIFGTSSGTTFIESASGIRAGGRTGLTAIVCAIWFLPFLFLAPLIGAVPLFATSPVLILVGLHMLGGMSVLSQSTWVERLPALLTFALIPLTFSITQGVLWGLLSHFLVNLFMGNLRGLKGMTVILGILSAYLLWFGH